MEFCLLGPLTVRCGGTALAVPRGRQRAVLAALLLRGNHVVSAGELAEALWGADLPPSARVSVQNYVMRLRNTLGPAGSRIATHPHGYLIGLGDGELDIARFEALLGEARAAAREGRWPQAAGRAAAALALWRGEPLADTGSEVLAAQEAPRLAELRLQAAETRIDADLHLGRHGEVIGELIILDNARDEQQVRPLLPASPGSLVIVTSRNQLSGLAAADGARLVALDVLSHGEAVRLLTARLGSDRAAAEPGAVDRIANLCACLPLALAVAAARSAARPGFPLAALAAELADLADRLDALEAGDPVSSMRAVFSWSTRQLSGEAARMFRLLGIHPGPDITAAAAASLAAITEADARRLLRELARAHLIIEHVPGRYAFHDLLRAYATEQAHAHDNQGERDAATGRVLDHYLHTAARAALLRHPAKEPVVLGPPRPGTAPEQLADQRQALAWFEAEHRVLLAAFSLAAGSGLDTFAWQLPWAMAPFLQARGHRQEWATAQRTALVAATRLGDTAAQALSSRLLANACTDLGDHDQARSHYVSSLQLYQRLGNGFGEAKIHHNLGVLAERQGRYADALGHGEQALRLYQAIGDKPNEAIALNDVGWYHGFLGDYQQARAFCRQALTLCAEVVDCWVEGEVWDSLGYAEQHLGNLTEAAACYQRALNLYRESGDRFDEADVLTRLGDTRHAVGELAQAREAWQQALAILEDLQHPEVGQVRAKLASTNDHASANPSV